MTNATNRPSMSTKRKRDNRLNNSLSLLAGFQPKDERIHLSNTIKWQEKIHLIRNCAQIVHVALKNRPNRVSFMFLQLLWAEYSWAIPRRFFYSRRDLQGWVLTYFALGPKSIGLCKSWDDDAFGDGQVNILYVLIINHKAPYSHSEPKRSPCLALPTLKCQIASPTLKI